MAIVQGAPIDFVREIQAMSSEHQEKFLIALFSNKNVRNEALKVKKNMDSTAL